MRTVYQCAGSVILYSFITSRETEIGSRLLDSGVDADFPEDLSARCHIDKAGGSDERMLSSIG